jgi:hypothetical protein
VKGNKERFRDYLKAKKLSFSRCGRLLNMDGVSLWRYVAGLREPSREVRKKMKQKLGFDWKESHGTV